MTESKKRGRPAATESRTEKDDLAKRLFIAQVASDHTTPLGSLAMRAFQAADAFLSARKSVNL